jgi:hypothetical protein
VSAARRACPACLRRYAGVIAPDCPVCRGLGTITLGAAALASADPRAVARAIELYLETAARRARETLPVAQLREALTAAVDDLRHAGVIAGRDAGHEPSVQHPPAPVAPHVAEQQAVTLARGLGEPVAERDRAALIPAAVAPIRLARPERTTPIPVLSAAGARSSDERAADVIDQAVAQLAAKRRRAAQRDRTTATA